MDDLQFFPLVEAAVFELRSQQYPYTTDQALAHLQHEVKNFGGYRIAEELGVLVDGSSTLFCRELDACIRCNQLQPAHV